MALFRSFFMGGFECSCHRLRSGRRLDVIAATAHDRHAAADYDRLRRIGIQAARDGVRWHLVEPSPGRYDFASLLPQLRAARASGTQVVWDICHYGWPDDLDIFSPAFVRRLAGLARAVAGVVAAETDGVPFFAPINEISFWSWAGGDAAYLNPFRRGRGYQLKVQLARAALAATDAIWSVAPQARIVHPDPLINVICAPERPHQRGEAAGHHAAQFQAWDMLAGRLEPQLGGDPRYLDILGVNYYSNNQWIHAGPPIDRHHPLYRPFAMLLYETYARYGRPLFVAETGSEGAERPAWLRYIGGEVRAALRAGVPVEGVCLYPIVNHPGWDDDRHCHNGLWDYPDADGGREIDEPLAAELRRQQGLFRPPTDSATAAPPAPAIPALLAAATPTPASPITPAPVALAAYPTRPTVCLFTDSLEPSGLGVHMLTLAAELRRDHRVLLAAPPTTAGRALLDGARALGLATLPITVRGDRRAPYDALVAWLHRQGVDIFHGHAGIGGEGHDGIYAAREAGVPVVIRTEHLPNLVTDPVGWGWLARVHAMTDRVICVSDEAGASFRAAGLPAQKLRVVRNGIRLAAAAPDRPGVRAALGLPSAARIVLTVGRLTPQKGHRLLLAAAPAVARAVPQAAFVWAGEGPLAGELRARVRAAGLADRVRLVGRRDDVPALMAAADLLAVPSQFEGLPLVVLEAMAVGLPVVGTAVCGTREAVADGVTGRLVPPGEPGPLAAALIDALGDPTTAAGWAARAAAAVERDFGAARMAREVVACYRESLAERADRDDDPRHQSRAAD